MFPRKQSRTISTSILSSLTFCLSTSFLPVLAYVDSAMIQVAPTQHPNIPDFSVYTRQVENMASHGLPVEFIATGQVRQSDDPKTRNSFGFFDFKYNGVALAHYPDVDWQATTSQCVFVDLHRLETPHKACLEPTRIREECPISTHGGFIQRYFYNIDFRWHEQRSWGLQSLGGRWRVHCSYSIDQALEVILPLIEKSSSQPVQSSSSLSCQMARENLNRHVLRLDEIKELFSQNNSYYDQHLQEVEYYNLEFLALKYAVGIVEGNVGLDGFPAIFNELIEENLAVNAIANPSENSAIEALSLMSDVLKLLAARRLPPHASGAVDVAMDSVIAQLEQANRRLAIAGLRERMDVIQTQSIPRVERSLASIRDILSDLHEELEYVNQRKESEETYLAERC